MKRESIKTEVVRVGTSDLLGFLDRYVSRISNGDVLVISSKVVSLLEANVAPLSEDKDSLIQKEADYISKEKTKNGHHIVIKHNALIFGAGIDSSNGDEHYVLLPKAPMKAAHQMYKHLAAKFGLDKFGVIISDSRSLPLRRGTVGVALGFWGFSPLHNYVGEKDLFGRKFVCEVSNTVDSLAIAANLVMGEGTEQTPLAIISDVPFVSFSPTSPTDDELKRLNLSLDDDLFYPFYKDIF